MDDYQVRSKAFEWLAEQVEIYDYSLPWSLLLKGFDFKGQRVPLVFPQGIFKPAVLDLPISITSVYKGPYKDRFDEESSVLYYKYQGTNPNHRDNVGLREALYNELPLIYFHGLMPGKYYPVWPVYIVYDDRANLTFYVEFSDVRELVVEKGIVAENREYKRSYITSTVQVRLHQRGFRERVLHAYRSQCALCRLKHRELLDAAHIVSDREPEGKPTVDNGIALCKLHHAAFDRFIIGVTPDYSIKVRSDILNEIDGPMLQHGLKDLHDSRLILPPSKKAWPDRDLLDIRFSKFKQTG